MVEETVIGAISHALTWFLIAACLSVVLVLENLSPNSRKAITPNFDNPLTKFGIFFAATIWLVLVSFTLASIAHLFLDQPSTQGAKDDLWGSRLHYLAFVGLIAALGGLVALPLNLIRIRQTNRANENAENVLFNEKVNAASLGLAARKQVSKVVGRGNNKRVLTTWDDDKVTRNSAIARLESLAIERPDEAQNIANQLSAYVRKISQEDSNPPEPIPNEGELWNWAQRLVSTSTDTVAAVQALGRLQNHARIDINIDVRESNLRAISISHLFLQSADFEKANLNGAKLIHADLKQANLSFTEAIGATFEHAKLQRATLQFADLRYATFPNAIVTSANFLSADLSGAYLRGANFNETNVSQANLTGAIAHFVDFRGADLRNCKMHATLLKGAILAGADVGGAMMDGVEMDGVTFDQRTNFAPTTLEGAGLRNVDVSNIHDPELLSQAFGDGSATLPKNWVAGEGKLFHWRSETLGDQEFQQAWRAYQKSIGYTPPKT